MNNKNTIDYIGITRAWVQEIVIGLNLCPFAKAPFRAGKIRFIVYEEGDVEALMKLFLKELELLTATIAGEIETTLIIHPNILNDFEAYLDAISLFESLIESTGLEGVLQVASFHPEYQFAGTGKDDAQNYTNRSPFPMLHLIREDSISDAVDNYPDIDLIPEKNIKKLEEMGSEEMKKLFWAIVNRPKR